MRFLILFAIGLACLVVGIPQLVIAIISLRECNKIRKSTQPLAVVTERLRELKETEKKHRERAKRNIWTALALITAGTIALLMGLSYKP